MKIQQNNLVDFDIYGLTFDLSNDQFLKSEKSSPYTSFNVDVSAFYTSFKNTVLTSSYELSGGWHFKTTNGLKMENSDVNENALSALSSAITVKWCRDNLISELENLKKKLGDEEAAAIANQKIPSFVGQIIITSVDTSNKMTKLYGGNWKQLSGEFLLGCGYNDKNNDTTFGDCGANVMRKIQPRKKGGNKNIKLISNNVPRHYHTFVNGNISGGTPTGKEIKLAIYPEAINDPSKGSWNEYDLGVLSVGYTWSKGGRDESGWPGRHTNKHHGGDDHGPGNYGTGVKTLTNFISSIVKSKSFTKTVGTKPIITIKERGGNEFHSNMPKYVCKYIWERIS